MTEPAERPVESAMASDVVLTRRRFTVEDYHRMAEAGILHEDDRVELIRGEIVEMAPIGIRHASCVARLTEFFVTRLQGRAILWPQNPLVILPDSEPQPDIVLLRYREDFYRPALPQPPDVVLVVEVADTTVRYDRRVKAPLYAEPGVREYWIVNLEESAIEVYRDPRPTGYAQRDRVGPGGRLAPQAFPDVVLDVAEVLR